VRKERKTTSEPLTSKTTPGSTMGTTQQKEERNGERSGESCVVITKHRLLAKMLLAENPRNKKLVAVMEDNKI